MNALELAEHLDDLGNWYRVGGETAAMLRRQHEVIAKLREALQEYVIQDELADDFGYGIGGKTKDMAEQALKDTAQFDSLNQPAFTEDLK